MYPNATKKHKQGGIEQSCFFLIVFWAESLKRDLVINEKKNKKDIMIPTSQYIRMKCVGRAEHKVIFSLLFLL